MLHLGVLSNFCLSVLTIKRIHHDFFLTLNQEMAPIYLLFLRKGCKFANHYSIGACCVMNNDL